MDRIHLTSSLSLESLVIFGSGIQSNYVKWEGKARCCDSFMDIFLLLIGSIFKIILFCILWLWLHHLQLEVPFILWLLYFLVDSKEEVCKNTQIHLMLGCVSLYKANVGIFFKTLGLALYTSFLPCLLLYLPWMGISYWKSPSNLMFVVVNIYTCILTICDRIADW